MSEADMEEIVTKFLKNLLGKKHCACIVLLAHADEVKQGVSHAYASNCQDPDVRQHMLRRALQEDYERSSPDSDNYAAETKELDIEDKNQPKPGDPHGK